MLQFIVFCVFLLFWVPFAITAKRSGFNSKWFLFAILSNVLMGIALIVQHNWSTYLWFAEDVKYTVTFWTNFKYKTVPYVASSFLSFLILVLPAGIMLWRIKAAYAQEKDDRQRYDSPALATWVTVLGSIVVALLCGAFITYFGWEKFLLLKNQVAFNQVDPILGKDNSYYMMALPAHIFTTWCLLGLFIISGGILTCLWLYVSEHDFDYYEHHDRLAQVLMTAPFLGIAVTIAVLFRLLIPTFLYGGGSLHAGPDYTTVHVTIPQLKAFTWVFSAAAVTLIFCWLSGKLKLAAWTSVALLCYGLIMLLAVPGIYQHTKVKNDERKLELTFVDHSIKGTRNGFKINDYEERVVDVVDSLTHETITKYRSTFRNLPLWDYASLLEVYENLQSRMTYYGFAEVDIDRYMINGDYRMVMLGARELDMEALPGEAKNWINTTMRYTHGYGFCMNTISDFTPEGNPVWVVDQLPPRSFASDIQVGKPRTYFGRWTSNHKFVKTLQPELDYATEEGSVDNTYDGTGGVRIGSGLRRFAFALRFDGFPTQTSRMFTDSSRVLFWAKIQDRVKKVAPFLVLDEDKCYVVRQNNPNVFIQDAYTLSNNFPYSKSYRTELGTLNYIRNSVKAVVDCLNGTVDLYIFDEQDPLIQAYSKAFPGLFKPKAEFPQDLRAHLRYPEQITTIQGTVLAVYHMTKPTDFFDKPDAWEISKGKFHDEVRAVFPYYAITQLPGEEKEEFIQLLPFTAWNKPNMTGWLAARCDGENYGKLLVLRFNKDKQITGTQQMESFIDIKTEMAGQFTLWANSNTQVKRGTLIVLPLGHSLLYTEPILLQTEMANARIPQIRKVIIGCGQTVVWGNTKEAAIEQYFTERYHQLRETNRDGNVGGKSLAEIISLAKMYINEYRTLTSQGDFTEAGRRLAFIEELLKNMEVKEKQ